MSISANSLSSESRDPTLLEIMSMILRHRLLILRVTLLCSFIGGLLAIASSRTYTSDFSFTPQEGGGRGGLSALASDFGVDLGRNEAQSPDFYIDLIHTREIVWPLLDTKFTLPSPKGPQTFALLDSIAPEGKDIDRRRDEATKTLRAAITSRINQRTSVVTVSVQASSPAFAKQLAERLIAEINRFNNETRRSRAAAQREFAQQRVAEARVALRTAEDRNEQWLSNNKIFAQSAELQFERSRLERDVGLRNQEYLALIAQYQGARMEEVRNTPVITIVERPALPTRHDPRGAVSKTVVGGFLGFILATLISVVRESLRRSSSTIPQSDAIEFAQIRADMAAELRHPKDTISRLFLLSHRKRKATAPMH